jgi:peptidoglycan/xylan/chitin deacetylase (PgdA/CDA1 family)
MVISIGAYDWRKHTMKEKRLAKIIGITLGIVLIFLIYLIISPYFLSKKETLSNDILDINGSKYNAAKKIELALEELKSRRQEASIIKGVDTTEKVVAITFDDLADYKSMESILELLDLYSAKATFFIPGIKGAEDPSIVERILDKKQEIGNYTLSGIRQMELLSEKELVRDFCLSGAILKEMIGKEPTILKCSKTKYTKELLEVADACGIENVVESTHLFNYQSFSSYEMTLGYISRIKQGDIISIKVRGYLGPEEYKATEKEEKPAADKKVSIKAADKKDSYLNEQEQLLQVIRWILQALDETGYKTEFVKDLPDFHRHKTPGHLSKREPVKTLKNQTDLDFKIIINNQNIDRESNRYNKLRLENQGKLSKIINNVYTAQPAVSYLFRGVSNKSTVDNILEVLDSLNAKATFFVTGKEIISYPDTISSIVSRGHSLANGGYGENHRNPGSLSYDEISYEIEMGERILKAFLGEKYGPANKYYMPLYGDAKGFVLEAASALGYENVIMYNRNPVLSPYKNLDANTIIEKYYKNVLALHRGDIVYFRLDFLTQPMATEDLVLKTAEKFIKASNYDIVPIDQLTTNPLVYIPIPEWIDNLGSLIKDSYSYNVSILQDKILNNYIGSPSISTAKNLPGFSQDEIDNGINITGKIDTNGEKVIFLTFDDWGSDIIVSKLLSVLNKHNVKASFFIRVGTDKLPYEEGMINPNLLRAIALEGHDIGNHTFSHMKIDITKEEEKQLLQKDIVTAHREMARYIGDLDALKPFFRPPTLAVSKLGMRTVFDTGYSYIINGDFNTQDYNAPSLEFLVDILKNGINTADRESNVTHDTPDGHIRKIQPGSIVIMHMSDESKYTPDALDIIIPYYINQGYRFDKLSNYLEDDYKGIP